MTAAVAEKPDTEDAEAAADAAEKKNGRDFTKFRPSHQGLADFVNANEDFKKAGLGDVTPGQVKAILALRTDFNDTPEKRAEREARKKELEAEKALYANMTPEEIAVEKAARKEEKQAAKLEAKIAEARAKAAKIRESKNVSGADLAAAVEANQAGAEKRTLGKTKVAASK